MENVKRLFLLGLLSVALGQTAAAMDQNQDPEEMPSIKKIFWWCCGKSEYKGADQEIPDFKPEEPLKRILRAHPEIDINKSKDGVSLYSLFFYKKENMLGSCGVHERGLNPLHIACNRGTLDVVKLLLQQEKIDVNKEAFGGYSTNGYDKLTPLGIAVFSKRLDVVKELLNHPDTKINWKQFSTAAPTHHREPFFFDLKQAAKEDNFYKDVLNAFQEKDKYNETEADNRERTGWVLDNVEDVLEDRREPGSTDDRIRLRAGNVDAVLYKSFFE